MARLLPRTVCKSCPALAVSAAVAGTVVAPEDIPDTGAAVEAPVAGGIEAAAQAAEARAAGPGGAGSIYAPQFWQYHLLYCWTKFKYLPHAGQSGSFISNTRATICFSYNNL